MPMMRPRRSAACTGWPPRCFSPLSPCTPSLPALGWVPHPPVLTSRSVCLPSVPSSCHPSSPRVLGCVFFGVLFFVFGVSAFLLRMLGVSASFFVCMCVCFCSSPCVCLIFGVFVCFLFFVGRVLVLLACAPFFSSACVHHSLGQTILAAVVAHKWLAGFALSTSLLESGTPRGRTLLMIVGFSLSTPLGTAAATLATSALQGSAKSLAQGILVGLSAGSFLYISLLEILAKELHPSKHHDITLRIVLLLVGVAIMATVAAWG